VIVDLHNHYAVQVMSNPDGLYTIDRVTRARERPGADRLKAIVLGIASRLSNYRSWYSGPRVTMEGLAKGDVRVLLAVVLDPFDEANLGDPYASPPEPHYPKDIRDQLTRVMDEVERRHKGEARFVKSPAELDAALAAGEVALIPAIEGGFHLGADPKQVRETVAELAGRGVGYVTLAHLLPRRVATNAHAFPFVSDRLYNWLLARDADEGLTELGRAAVEAMLAHRVLIDLSHMNRAALDETFELLDELDPGRRVPVIASHTVCREPNGKLEYNFTDSTIRQIAERGGVMGLIMGDRLASDGLRKPRRRRRATKDREDSIDVLMAHVEHMHEVTGSHDHTGIGTDLDGFIKPTLAGIEQIEDVAHFAAALRERYGEQVAEAVCSGNALRVLRGYWGAS
jgi:microsomal dipeptidase-like Zn-dependent dipeptidase